MVYADLNRAKYSLTQSEFNSDWVGIGAIVSS